MTGPTGPTGRAGATGAQGESGEAGAQGATTEGVAGASGTVGATGAAGPGGPVGPEGSAGVIERWTSYRDFWFDADMAVIHDADTDQVAEIAAYMNENPSLVLGIDGSSNPRATEQAEQDLSDRRIEVVRDSLVDAGVSADRITDGMFGDVNLRRDGRVEVLIRTDQRSAAQIEQARAPSTARATSARGTDMTTDNTQAGVVEAWTCYREFWFDDDAVVIHPADAGKVTAIAAYLNENPSMQIGIDSASNPEGNDGADLSLARGRGTALRTALVEAGVPTSSIQTGSFGDAELWRDGRVAVLVNTGDLSPADLGTASPTLDWACYQELWFDADTFEIHPADLSKVTEMAAYLKANPRVKLGIDSTLSAESDHQADLDLAERRGDAVRDALIAAGVPTASIESGALGDVDFRRDGRVEVLIKTDRLAQGQ